MHQTKINMLTFSAFFMSRDRKEGLGGVVSFSVYDKTLANSQTTDIPTLKLRLRCAVLFHTFVFNSLFLFVFFSNYITGWFVKLLLVADSPRERGGGGTMWLTFKHKRTSVESGRWSGAQRASCGHNRPPASQITDRWGMQAEERKKKKSIYNWCRGKMCF